MEFVTVQDEPEGLNIIIYTAKRRQRSAKRISRCQTGLGTMRPVKPAVTKMEFLDDICLTVIRERRSFAPSHDRGDDGERVFLVRSI
jgi:hypothetical protein